MLERRSLLRGVAGAAICTAMAPMSPACSSSPHWAQRTSAWVRWPQVRCRRRTGGPASPAVQRSPQAVIAISTSGNSKNIQSALAEAKKGKFMTIALLGRDLAGEHLLSVIDKQKGY